MTYEPGVPVFVALHMYMPACEGTILGTPEKSPAQGPAELYPQQCPSA